MDLKSLKTAPIVAPKEVRLERLKTCLDCEFLRGSLIMRCGKCSCPIKTKVAVHSTKCPEGKW